jgi:hypothetical protein
MFFREIASSCALAPCIKPTSIVLAYQLMHELRLRSVEMIPPPIILLFFVFFFSFPVALAVHQEAIFSAVALRSWQRRVAPPIGIRVHANDDRYLFCKCSNKELRRIYRK